MSQADRDEHHRRIHDLIQQRDQPAAETDPAFCRRCGHACNHTPPHVLVETTDGPICADEDWCTQLRHADENRRAGIGAERRG